MSYIKPGPNFKMAKSIKRSLATSRMIDPHYRGEQKRLMIQAQLHSEIQIKREKRRGPSSTEDASE